MIINKNETENRKLFTYHCTIISRKSHNYINCCMLFFFSIAQRKNGLMTMPYMVPENASYILFNKLHLKKYI